MLVNLRSQWADAINQELPLPEYPRPQLVREQWVNLNGKWDACVHSPESEPDFSASILVPFPLGSALSGFDHVLQPDEVLTMRTYFEHSFSDGPDRLRLHFGGVDWACEVWINDVGVGSHTGGFDPFYIDITDALIPGSSQKLVISITDPTDTGNQPLGKQTLTPFAIQYTAVAGIWQTVWLEPVPQSCIERVYTETAIAAGIVTVNYDLSNTKPGTQMNVRALDGETVVSQGSELVEGNSGSVLLSFDDLHSWCPRDPFLYSLEIEITDGTGDVLDRVESYFGAREVSCEPDDSGHMRLHLNGSPIFHLGLLDQGWWPDGLLTAPTDEALKFDIEATLEMGFNTIRKHVKVEPARWYWHADRLGVLVWQDMPSTVFNMVEFGKQLKKGVEPEEMEWDSISPGKDPEGFRSELDAMLTALQPFASIVAWVPFNEAWGQHDTNETLAHVMRFDPTRLVDGPSGWTDLGLGHMRDHHLYQGAEQLPEPESGRATVYGEFGGISLYIDGHSMFEKGWGYTKTESVEDFLTSYEELLTAIGGLIPEGLAGAIYTQTTDVESEINGLLTYDRKYKLQPEKVRLIHEKIL